MVCLGGSVNPPLCTYDFKQHYVTPPQLVCPIVAKATMIIIVYSITYASRSAFRVPFINTDNNIIMLSTRLTDIPIGTSWLNLTNQNSTSGSQ